MSGDSDLADPLSRPYLYRLEGVSGDGERGLSDQEGLE